MSFPRVNAHLHEEEVWRYVSAPGASVYESAHFL